MINPQPFSANTGSFGLVKAIFESVSLTLEVEITELQRWNATASGDQLQIGAIKNCTHARPLTDPWHRPAGSWQHVVPDVQIKHNLVGRVLAMFAGLQPAQPVFSSRHTSVNKERTRNGCCSALTCSHRCRKRPIADEAPATRRRAALQGRWAARNTSKRYRYELTEDQCSPEMNKGW